MIPPEPVKVYEGKITRAGHAIVTVNGRPLPLNHDVRLVSSTGFQWGFGGQGPQQLALALAVDVFGSDDEGRRHADLVLTKIVKQLTMDQPWVLTDLEIHQALQHGLPKL